MKFLRNFAIIAVIVALFVLIIMNSSTKRNPADQVWREATTVGNLEAENYYVMYTDIMCPYCDVFSRAVMEHWDEFQAYLAEHDILFEVRVTDILYASGSTYSRAAGEAAYCAMYENKFWDFYHGVLTALWNDYHSKGIGSSKTAPHITDLPEDYWLKIGRKAGLGEQFEQCVTNHESTDELNTNTIRAAQVVEGLPYFRFNDFQTAGFGDGWGWDYAKLLLDAGLQK